jgi:hypothetical protein
VYTNEYISFLEKTATKEVKRKASPRDKIPKKRKDSTALSMLNSSKKSRSSTSLVIECPVDIFHLKLI